MIVKVPPTGLSAERAIDQIDRAISLVSKASTFEDVQKIRDTAAMTDAFLRTKQAATLLGERAIEVKQKAERLHIDADRRLGELIAALPANERTRTLTKSGITNSEATKAELAARLSKKQTDAYVKIRHATNMEANTNDLARLGRLDPAKRVDAILALKHEPSVTHACGDDPNRSRDLDATLDTLLKVRAAWLAASNVRVFSEWLNKWIDKLKKGK